MKVASRPRSRELYKLTGWRGDLGMWFEIGTQPGARKKWAIGPKGEFPAYPLGYLVHQALATGHTHVKIKKGRGKHIVTAPPCYHIEARTAEDAMAKLLIRSAKAGRI